MPDRYVFVDVKTQEIGKNKQVFARTERDAMQIRGVRIYNKTTSAYSSSIVYPSLSYEIQVPIYNASFLPSDGSKSLTVPMKLYYRKAGSSENGTLIGEPIAATNVIGGWTKGTENNKALVKFNWDNVPELPQGAYEFYAVIDPDNVIDEVHEAWSKDTPEGNNTGYYPFGISYGGETVDTDMTSNDFAMKFKTRSGKTGAFVSASDAQDNDYTWTDWVDFAEHRTDVANMVDGETEFVMSLKYSDVDVLNEAWVEVLMESDDEYGEEYTYVFASEMIQALASGDEYEFSFILDEDEVKHGRNLRMVISDFDDEVEYSLGVASSSQEEGIIRSSSGGCYTSTMAGSVIFAVLMMFRKHRR